MKRGAELHDLFMAHRFDRAAAVELRVLTMMNRLASEWREEDRVFRAGRPSWHPPQAIAERHPTLRAVRLVGPRRRLGRPT